MKALKKHLSMLLALLMCFGVFSGMGITAFAAGEEMTTYLVDLPRSADPQKTGWDHPALNLMGGWTVDESSHFTVHAQDSFNGRAVTVLSRASAFIPATSIRGGMKAIGIITPRI